MATLYNHKMAGVIVTSLNHTLALLWPYCRSIAVGVPPWPTTPCCGNNSDRRSRVWGTLPRRDASSPLASCPSAPKCPSWPTQSSTREETSPSLLTRQVSGEDWETTSPSLLTCQVSGRWGRRHPLPSGLARLVVDEGGDIPFPPDSPG